MTSILKWSQWMLSLEVKNEKGVWFNSLSNRGIVGWLLALFLSFGYITLYFFPEWLGLGQKGMPNTGFIAWFDQISIFFNGSVASQWFVYGFLYTLIILLMGIKFIIKYKNNNYQVIRTLSLLFFQLCFAFIIPEIMASMSLVPGTPSVEIEGIAYGDGGFRDTVPVKSLIENVPKLDVIYVVNVNTEKRKWNSNILANNNASLAERLKFMYDDILWDENNRSDIEIGKLKFWNSDKYIIIYPEVMNVTTTDFSPTSIKEAYLHGMSMGRKYTK